jgi:hypothetical protein
MTLAEISLIEGIRGQPVPGYPNDGQLLLYAVVPLIGFVGSAVILGFAKALLCWAKRIGMGISFFAPLPIFMMFGGGVRGLESAMSSPSPVAAIGKVETSCEYL